MVIFSPLAVMVLRTFHQFCLKKSAFEKKWNFLKKIVKFKHNLTLK